MNANVALCQLDVELGLGDMSRIKYHNIFDQITLYRHCDNIVGMIGAFIKYLHNEIFDK